MPENDAIAVLRGSAEARQCRGAPRPKNGRGGNVGETWGRRGGDVGETWGKRGGNVGETWGKGRCN